MPTTASRRVRALLAPLVLIFLAASSAVRADDAKPAPRVLIISIDGMRPDLMLRSKTPHIHALFESGAFSFWAKTVPHAITLPSHVSMLTGAIPRRHEVEWNVDLPPVSVWPEKANFPKVPTLFEMAHKAGYTTALAAGKSKFDIFNRRDALDSFSVPTTAKGEDVDVRDAAVKMIHEHKPQVMFVHLPSTDNVGHKVGWATPEQIAAIEGADICVGDLLKALDDEKLREGTVVLLTSDHGGAGLTHLPDDPRARHITWILNGPGVRKNFDLSRLANLTINTEDTCATACKLLKITPEKPLDGKPILEALEDAGELTKPAQ
jgi:predicted AlkP superfamily pyrophosphatase or phosphodiesterase